ncbi:hypothetical protein J7552_09500 [Wohlfahrtiimonas chitiniclastica]|uniref:hypothetical protein n=1 Tax=Wohlfahrtiimonas chitiniclastica TaxID=400946 RepID=UPI001BCB0516|nr:hypothetical protein [Wohlfahrtiimonas chitiniclastica]MBS7821512.1 hypothetical protein [Wohlfahrtiimonas chitiniclastica]
MSSTTMEERLCELAELKDLWDEIRDCGMFDQENVNINAIEKISYIAYLSDDHNDSDKAVLDVHPYFVDDDNEWRLHSFLDGNTHKNIVIVLESPHIYDYPYVLSYDNYNDDMSPTLRVIHEYKEQLFMKLVRLCSIQKNEHYKIRIIDSVPFMASLGLEQNCDTKKITYRIWNAIWNKCGYKNKFIQFLEALPKDSIVLNACTNYRLNHDQLSPKIQILDAVINSDSNPYYGRLSHPSSMKHVNSSNNYINSIKNLSLRKFGNMNKEK